MHIQGVPLRYSYVPRQLGLLAATTPQTPACQYDYIAAVERATNKLKKILVDRMVCTSADTMAKVQEIAAGYMLELET